MDSSLNEEPGRDNPDARQFDQSTRSGASRRSDFTNATDPIVQEQVEEYNAMADTIDELEAEAEKYREQEKEMNELAQKSENNADNLVSSQKGVSGANAPSANGGAQNSTIAKSDEAEALTYAPNGTRELNSDISTKTAESESAANAKLLAKDTKTALSSSALPGAAAGSSVSTKGNLRETLRERLRNSSGSSSSADAEYSRGAGEMHSPGQGRSLASGKSGSGSGKEERPTIDSANTEESIGAFNQQLGGGDIGLAGSETDASVKAMLNEFGLSKEGNREPASLNSAEIGTKDGPSLFERCRATHKRCAKNGCVTQASGERAGG